MDKTLLQHIPYCGVFLVKKPGHSAHAWDSRINEKNYVMVDVALEAAAREPYNIVVSVNGAYGQINKPGQPIQRSATSGKGYSVLVLEFDEHWDNIKLRLQLLQLPTPSFISHNGNKYTLFYIVSDVDSRQVNYIHVNKYLCSATGAINKPVINGVFDLSGSILVTNSNWDLEEYNGAISNKLNAKSINKIDQNREAFSKLKAGDFHFQDSTIPEFLIGTQYRISEEGALYDGDKIIRGSRYNKNDDTVYSPVTGFHQGSITTFPQRLLGKNFLSHFQKFFDIEEKSGSLRYTDGEKVMMSTQTNTVLVYRAGEKDVAREIFSTPIEIKGRVFQKNKTRLGGYSETMEASFLIATPRQELFIGICSSQQDFDKQYNKSGLQFYGMPNDFKIFNDIITRDESIPLIDIKQSSGFYDGYCYLGSKVVAGEKSETDYVKPVFELSPPKGKQITAKQYAEMGCKVFTDDIFIIGFLQAIACCGMNLWNESNTVFPGLFITGTTGTGKTTFFEMLRTAMGFGRKERKYAINNMTPQVLQKEACDSSPLFLEEYTSVTNLKIESVLRNILNRDTGARGGVYENTVYPYCSPIIACGEHMPQATSVQNRFINLRIDNKNRIGNDSKISIMHAYTCYTDIYGTLLANASRLNELYIDQKHYLVEKGVHARAADVWGYAFAMNELFEIADKEDLYSYMDNHLKEMQISQTSFIGWEMRMLAILSKASMQQKVRIMTFDKGEDKVNYMFIFDDMRFNQNRAEIVSIIQDSKTNGNINYQGTNVNMIVDMKTEDESNMEVYNLVDRAKGMIRSN